MPKVQKESFENEPHRGLSGDEQPKHDLHQ